MGEERRRDTRVSVPLAITYRFAGDPVTVWHSASAINISAGGVRLRCEQFFELGTRIELCNALDITPGYY